MRVRAGARDGELVCPLPHPANSLRPRHPPPAGDAAAVALYTAASVATAALIHWRRGVYARHRELLTAAGAALHAWMWLRLVLGGGLGLARLHGASPLRLLGMLAVCNYSLFAFLYFVHGRMPVAAMRLVLPLLALQPVSLLGAGALPASLPACGSHAACQTPARPFLLRCTQLAQGGRLCRCLLAEPGAEQAIADLSHALTAFQ